MASRSILSVIFLMIIQKPLENIEGVIKTLSVWAQAYSASDIDARKNLKKVYIDLYYHFFLIFDLTFESKAIHI